MAPSVKLSYFPIEARAEKVRLALVVTKTEFEDNRVPKDQWPALKPTTPFGQMPVLEIKEENGEVLTMAQSVAMLRYVARRFDSTGSLLPSDLAMMTEVEEACELAEDMWRDFLPMLRVMNGGHTTLGHPAEWPEKAEVLKAMGESAAQVGVPKYLQILTSKIEKTGSYVCSSNHLTIADLHWFSYCRMVRSGLFGMLPEGVVEKFPKVIEWMDRIYAIPEVKKWYGL